MCVIYDIYMHVNEDEASARWQTWSFRESDWPPWTASTVSVGGCKGTNQSLLEEERDVEERARKYNT